MRLRSIYILAFLSMIAACASAIAEEVVHLDATAQARIGVVVRPVLERSFGDQVRVLGEIVRSPGTTIPVKTVVPGRVTEIFVNPGNAVTAGQRLLTIHSHELHRLEGALLLLTEERLLAESRFDAGEQLFEIDGIARVELDRRRQEVLAARIAEDGARLELIDLGYSDRDVKAVLDEGSSHGELVVRARGAGVVLELDVRRHEWIQSFDPLLTIGDPKRVELEVRLPPAYAEKVRVGDLVEFVPVGQPANSRRARVVSRVPAIDPVTRMVRVRARIEKGEDSVPLPGTFVQGTLVHGASRSGPSVPEAAVTRIGGNDHVFIRLGPGAFAARAVTLGHFNGRRYEILEGVQVGEEVVVEGVFLLKSTLLQGESEE